MFCIQTCVLETFGQQVDCAKGTDHYPFPRAAFVGTGTAKDAAGMPKLLITPPRYPNACDVREMSLGKGDRALTG